MHLILKYLKQNFAFKNIFILLFYVKDESTIKGALKYKSIFVTESCDFKFHRNIMIFRLLLFKKMVTHSQKIFIGFIKNF